MICEHKYVLKRTDTFYSTEGRNENKYTLIDYYFCEKCLHEEVKKKVAYCSYDRTDEMPDWAKTITKQVAR
jgi:hypothetical protein